MNILTLENVSKSFSEKNLFEDVSMGIDSDDRIGLVGINGTGKTTFLKLVSGAILPDSGKVVRGSSVRIQFLLQNPSFNENLSVLNNILQGDNPVIRTIRQYEAASGQFNENPDNKNIQKKFMELSLKMDLLDAWNIKTRAENILDRLGISEPQKPLSELSGGQKKRVALAEALVQPAELLILDEPTNHIDLETIGWLEEFLSQRKGALLMVTHDRYFLNRIVSRIIEIDRKKLYSYAGNFEYFLEKKTQRKDLLATNEQKRKRLYLNELAWMRRGAKARTTKQKARIQRFEEIRNLETKTSKEQFEIPVAFTRLGKKAIEINNISKAFGAQTVIKSLSIIINPNERMGIVGPNGSGKTTLLNLIAGIFIPDSGSISLGETVKIAYYRQENTELEPDVRAIDFIRSTAEYVTTEDGKTMSAARMLEQFLFDDTQRYSFIKNLSGGEKRRLLLAKVLMEKPNVLLLDEPTNDLDIQTLEALEEYLSYFKGVVLVSSHDRFFLKKTTDSLLALKEGGAAEMFTGVDSYTKNLAAGIQKPSGRVQTKKAQKSGSSGDKSIKASLRLQDTKSAKTNIKPKFTYGETREFETIDAEIEKLEESLERITKKMQSSWTDHKKIKELSKKHESLQKKLSAKMERWVYLNEKAELIRSYNSKRL